MKPTPPAVAAHITDGPIKFHDLARALKRAIGERPTTLTRLPLTWDVAIWPFRHPLDYLGFNGGGGLAAGPGIAVGVALALKNAGRLTLDGPEYLRTFLAEQIRVWGAVVREHGVKVD